MQIKIVLVILLSAYNDYLGRCLISLKNNSNTNERDNLLFGKALMLAIAYSASIGGMATLIGTPPNLVFAGIMKESYGIKISFFQWFKFGLPLSLLLLSICWVYLTKISYKFEQKKFPGGKKEIYELARKSYLVVKENGDGGPFDMIHTENFVLVDSKRRIRGFYDGTDSESMNQLIEDVYVLKNEF